MREIKKLINQKCSNNMIWRQGYKEGSLKQACECEQMGWWGRGLERSGETKCLSIHRINYARKSWKPKVVRTAWNTAAESLVFFSAEPEIKPLSFLERRTESVKKTQFWSLYIGWCGNIACIYVREANVFNFFFLFLLSSIPRRF